MSAFTVGLTGGLASGKSTVAAWLRDAGYEVVDADRLVADLYRAGAAGERAVARLFGDAYLLHPDGGVDRARLSALVFRDPAARRRLEEAIHPLVRERFRDLAAAAHGVLVLEATLLVEAGYAPDFDLMVTVEAEAATRLARAVARGMTEDEARARLAAQPDGVARRAAADRILTNDGSLADLRRQADALIAEVGDTAGRKARNRGPQPRRRNS